MARQRTSSRFADYDISVFVNCPFDSTYKPIFDGIVFAVILCGFRARCAFEIDDGGQTRIEKIFQIMEECRYGIHDLSRTELDAANNLPRFNMPLELGMFLGVKRGGEKLQRRKLCLVLDREPFRYQQFVSDIAGQDIRAHGAELKRVAGAIRDWLATGSERVLPGGLEICRQFEAFIQELPAWCERLQLQPEELTFADYTNFVTEWLKGRLPKPGPDA